MSSDVDAKTHTAALIALINGAGGHAYKPGDLKKMPTLPLVFTEIYVMARPDENGRVGALGGIGPGRVIARSVGNSENDAITERSKVAKVLLGSFFMVDGETFGPLRRETSEDTVDDAGDGLWSGESSWIYA